MELLAAALTPPTAPDILALAAARALPGLRAAAVRHVADHLPLVLAAYPALRDDAALMGEVRAALAAASCPVLQVRRALFRLVCRALFRLVCRALFLPV